MIQLPPKTLTILVDDREKDVTPFPKTFIWNDAYGKGHLIKLKTKKKRLSAGDFQVEGYEHIVALERKKNSKELWQNLCTKDRGRFNEALQRMVGEVQVPLLFVQVSLSELTRPTEYCPDPILMVDRLICTCIREGVLVYFAPSPTSTTTATQAGEFIARLLWNTVATKKGITCPPKPPPPSSTESCTLPSPLIPSPGSIPSLTAP